MNDKCTINITLSSDNECRVSMNGKREHLLYCLAHLTDSMLNAEIPVDEILFSVAFGAVLCDDDEE